MDYKQITDFIKSIFPKRNFIPLHEPLFMGNEKKYVNDAIDSTFVSSVGQYVTGFEKHLTKYVGCKRSIATMNGTAALHIALKLAGVKENSEVITQALTFVGTTNAISYLGASPIFIDVDYDTMGMSPKALKEFLDEFGEKKEDGCYNKLTSKKITACLPMHTFGFPCRIDELVKICDQFNISLVEDAAESIGSYYKNKHTGTFGLFGAFSFNGNKTITCGGGGAIITNNKELGIKAKHITTTAKVPHQWNYKHDQIAYNYRMPNLNAAMACAQLEQLDTFVQNKRNLADLYNSFFKSSNILFRKEIKDAKANNWLMAIELADNKEREEFLKYTNDNGVMTRPIWQLINSLSMYKNCQTDELVNSIKLEKVIVNIPSSVRIHE